MQKKHDRTVDTGNVKRKRSGSLTGDGEV